MARARENAFDVLADAFGEGKAERIVATLGGMTIYVPSEWKPDGQLAALGDDLGPALCATFGGANLDVPRLVIRGEERARVARRLWQEGYPINEIARTVECTSRSVRRYVKGLIFVGSPLTATRDKTIREGLAARTPFRVIAKLAGCSETVVVALHKRLAPRRAVHAKISRDTGHYPVPRCPLGGECRVHGKKTAK